MKQDCTLPAISHEQSNLQGKCWEWTTHNESNTVYISGTVSQYHTVTEVACGKREFDF